MRHLVYENECACECVGVCVQMGEGRILIPYSLQYVLCFSTATASPTVLSSIWANRKSATFMTAYCSS